MAKPAFIYAFDNLGSEKFIEVCGLLLASRYKGFLRGGIGPDGGVDGELDEILGEWCPEWESPLLNEVIKPGEKVVFQFKHRVTARIGQSSARTQLLRLYKCGGNEKCELHRYLIQSKQPSAYVLVTNIEVNSRFRAKFIEQCRAENSEIQHYQVIGLDELENWITMEPQLRHLYFPTIFGSPRFNLRIRLSEFTQYNGLKFLEVAMLNVGSAPSYVDSISIRVIKNGESKVLRILPAGDDEAEKEMNPKPGKAIESGRKQTHHRFFQNLSKKIPENWLPVEVIVYDEIGNHYSETIPEDLRKMMMG